MKRMSASEFKTQCLRVIEQVQATREPVLITKRGRPVAKLIPSGKPAKFLGRLKGIIKVVGDIESPVEPPSAWNVLRRD